MKSLRIHSLSLREGGLGTLSLRERVGVRASAAAPTTETSHVH